MSDYVWGREDTQFFYELNPIEVLNAIERLGFPTTGRCLPLNSMENRVYEIELDTPLNDGSSPSDYFVVAKFYRPGRWTKEQILDEHRFLLDLHENEIPVIAPIIIEGETLFPLEDHQLFYTIFPKQGGRNPDEFNDDQLEQLGRLLGRIHQVGKSRKAEHRLSISPYTFGTQNLNFLEQAKVLPSNIEKQYFDTAREIVKMMEPHFENLTSHRIHGDCHTGNILHQGQEKFFFVDFDDMLNGPPIQDIWLVLPGRDDYAQADRLRLLESYETMCDFDYQNLKLIEALRTLRYIHFSAWLTKRWEDPSFKVAFPHFGSTDYWNIQLRDLLDQKEAMDQAFNPPAYY